MTIKKHLIIAAAALAVMGCGLPSCKDIDDGNYIVSVKPYELLVSGSSVSKGDDGIYVLTASTLKESHITLSVYAITGEETWTFTNLPDWISVSPKSGHGSNSVTVTAQPNADYSNDREGIIYLASTNSDWSRTIGIKVTQKCAEPELSNAGMSSQFSWAGGTKTNNFHANFEPTVESTVDWLEASVTPLNDEGYYNNYTLTVTAQSNLSSTRRSGCVILKCLGTELKTIEFSQFEKQLFDSKRYSGE